MFDRNSEFFEDMLGGIEHLLRHLNVLNIVEILVLVPYLRIAQQQAVPAGFQRDDVLPVGQLDVGPASGKP
jgi:hypothetical protein